MCFLSHAGVDWLAVVVALVILFVVYSTIAILET